MSDYTPTSIVSLDTPRLILRPVEASDAPRIQELFDNFKLLKYMSTAIPWPYPETGASDYLRTTLPKQAQGEIFLWAIREKAHAEQGMIGQISLTPGSETENRGFWLGEPYWGNGYMTEVCRVVTDFAFGPLGMSELFLSNALPNRASHRLKEKAGAEILSIEDRDFIGGRFPSVSWKLTAEKWMVNRERFISPSPSA
jgi:ribosomal-protein-alanine N-acetyltransferase